MKAPRSAENLNRFFRATVDRGLSTVDSLGNIFNKHRGLRLLRCLKIKQVQSSMKSKLLFAAWLCLASLTASKAQEVQTIFKGGSSVGGFGALTNKFTTIRGEYANISGVYGGVYLNHHFLLGLEASAVTNDIQVPAEFSAIPGRTLSYQYGQFGMVNEYALGSNKAVHAVFHLFYGAGFTLQYNRHQDEDYFYMDLGPHDENWFFVVEPGVQLELNLFKWMRFSPGVSYRSTHGSGAKGMSDSDLSDWSYNVTLKFGRF